MRVPKRSRINPDSFLYKRALLTVGLLLLGVYPQLPLTQGARDSFNGQHLYTLDVEALLANPVAGLNAPDIAVEELQEFYGVTNVEVQTNLYLINLEIDEASDSFQARFWWHIEYDDPNVYGIIANSNSSATCFFPCSTTANVVVNAAGENACCDNIFIPKGFVRNLRSMDFQTWPKQWHVFADPDGHVNFWRHSVAVYEAALTSGGFPFDVQKVGFDVRMSYIPYLSDTGRSFLPLSAAPYQSLPTPPGIFPDVSKSSMPMHGWQVTAYEANVVGWKTRLGGLLQDNGDERVEPGVQFVLTVHRISKSFWTVLVVLPVCLQTLMLLLGGITQHRNMRGHLSFIGATCFGVMLLQHAAAAYQPPRVFVPPHLVTCGVYIFLFFLSWLYILVLRLQQSDKIGRRKRGYRAGEMKFEAWIRGALGTEEVGMSCKEAAFSPPTGKDAKPTDCQEELPKGEEAFVDEGAFDAKLFAGKQPGYKNIKASPEIVPESVDSDTSSESEGAMSSLDSYQDCTQEGRDSEVLDYLRRLSQCKQPTRGLMYFWFVLTRNEDQELADAMALTLERVCVPILFTIFYGFLITTYVTSTTVLAPTPDAF